MARGELNCFFREEAIVKRFLLNKVGTFQKFLLPKDGVCHFQHLEVYHQKRSSALGWIIIVRRCCKVMEIFDLDWTMVTWLLISHFPHLQNGIAIALTKAQFWWEEELGFERSSSQTRGLQAHSRALYFPCTNYCTHPLKTLQSAFLYERRTKLKDNARRIHSGIWSTKSLFEKFPEYIFAKYT